MFAKITRTLGSVPVAPAAAPVASGSRSPLTLRSPDDDDDGCILVVQGQIGQIAPKQMGSCLRLKVNTKIYYQQR